MKILGTISSPSYYFPYTWVSSCPEVLEKLSVPIANVYLKPGGQLII